MYGMLLQFAVVCFAQCVSAQTVSIKPGASIKLRANVVGDITSYQWFRNGNVISGAVFQDYIVSNDGRYTVISFNAGGCSGDPSEEMVVIMQTAISADVAILKSAESRQVVNSEVFAYQLLVRNNGPGEATNINVADALPDNLAFAGIDQPAVGTAGFDQSKRTISWNIPALENGNFLILTIKVKALKSGKVINSATVQLDQQDPDPTNNISTDTKEITGIHIPNVFTPNGDGKNETFVIERLGSYADNMLTVINRWGSTVYEKKAYLNDWTAEGLADGTYFYLLKVKDMDEHWQVFRGYVTITR